MSITIVYNKFDIDAVITAAIYMSHLGNNNLSEISLRKQRKETIVIESTSGIDLAIDKDSYFLFLGINRINNKFKDIDYVMINSSVVDDTYYTILERLVDSSIDNPYAQQLASALRVFNTREADEKDLIVLSKYYQLALKVIRGAASFEFTEVTEKDKMEYLSFIEMVKVEFTNNFHKKHPLPLQEGISYPAASISSDYCVWVRRFMKLVHKRYLNVILTTKGHIIDTDIPDIQSKLSGRNFILSSDY